VPARSSIAWTEEFFAEGRSWLVTTDLLLVPKDLTRRFAPSPFAGVDLTRAGMKLPLAFVRRRAAPQFVLRKQPGSRREQLVESSASWPRLSSFRVTGRIRVQGGERFVETHDAGRFARADDVSVITPASPVGLGLAEGEKWLDVSIDRGTLVAYEGSSPVFATLISPGMNGYKRVDSRPARGTTPTGVFRIEWKHRSTTMSPDPEKLNYALAEVPFTQFFHMPFALHAAYWHDRFGQPRSGGCVNLSLSDARRLFEWTEPRVPEDWHGVRAGGARGRGTWVRIR
jgi:hypothetical protein